MQMECTEKDKSTDIIRHLEQLVAQLILEPEFDFVCLAIPR